MVKTIMKADNFPTDAHSIMLENGEDISYMP